MYFKQLSVFFAIALFSSSFSSCAEILNVSPDGNITLDDVFSNKDNIGAYLNTCYTYVSTKGYGYFWTTPAPVVLSDEAWDADDTEGLVAARYYNGSVSASDNPLETPGGNNGSDTKCDNFWRNYWAGIRLCSNFIQHITPQMEEADKDYKRWKAEARVLRASYYSELLKWYGGVPVSDNPYNLNADFSILQRESYYDVVQFILKECDLALAVDDEIFPWRITSSGERLRVTKAVAEAIKSRVSLFLASPLNNWDKNGVQHDYWKEAYEINKVSLENLRKNGYELYKTCVNPEIFDVFGDTSEKYGDMSGLAQVRYEKGARAAAAMKEYFNTAADYSEVPRDKETIWQHIYVGRYGAAAEIWGIGGVGLQHAYKTGACPSQELVDSYDAVKADGTLATTVLDLENPYQDKHLGVNYFQGALDIYDPQKPYENRDPRFYITIYYNGCKRYTYWEDGTGEGMKVIWTDVDNQSFGFSLSSRIRTRTGYYAYKYITPTEGAQNFYIVPRPTKLIRLAEIILNFAEAAAEYAVKTNNAAVMEEAIKAVDEIRERAGMPKLSNSNPRPNIKNIVSLVRKERRVELAFEEDRYFSVRRWQDPDGDLRKTDEWITGMRIKRNGDQFVYTRSIIWNNPRRCWENKYLRQPIPQNEATNLEIITNKKWQNPNW